MPAAAGDRSEDSLVRMQGLLYSTPFSEVRGDLEEGVSVRIGRIVHQASAAVTKAVQDAELDMDGVSPDYVKVSPIKPDNGIVGGWTQGSDFIGLNSYTIPGTPEYLSFREQIGGGGGEFYDLLRKKYGTEGVAEDSLWGTTVHELLHYTQLNPLGRNGSFADMLVRSLEKRYHEKLPEELKILAKPLAYMSRVPLLEGANVVAEDEVTDGAVPYTIKQERGEGITTYDGFAAAAADAFEIMEERGRIRHGEGNSRALEFYRDAAEDPGLVDDYVEGFLESYLNRGVSGGYGDGRAATTASPDPMLEMAA